MANTLEGTQYIPLKAMKGHLLQDAEKNLFKTNVSRSIVNRAQIMSSVADGSLTLTDLLNLLDIAEIDMKLTTGGDITSTA